MDWGQLLGLFLHTVAFVIAWGYYGVLARIILPGLEGSLGVTDRAAALVSIERRALPLVVISMLAFIATGSYLLITNPSYTGLGDFFSNTWSTLMLVKHVVVVGIVVAGVAVELLIGSMGASDSDEKLAGIMRRVRWSAEAATALGALIALLTVAAEISA